MLFRSSVSSANNVTLNDTSALTLAASTISGNLIATTGGDITDSGTISVAGITTLSAAGHDITLDDNNDFNSLGITAAKNASINDINALVLNACSITGTLTVSTKGDITQSAPLSVTAGSSFNAGSTNSIALNNPANNFFSVSVSSADRKSTRLNSSH